MVPSVFSARLWDSPAATAVTPLRVLTCTGVERLVLVPSPNCPHVLSPQAQTVASFLSARLWEAPPPMDVTPVRFATWPVVMREAPPPSPSWPEELLPQVHTPSTGVDAARAGGAGARSAATSTRAATAADGLRRVIEVLPSGP